MAKAVRDGPGKPARADPLEREATEVAAQVTRQPQEPRPGRAGGYAPLGRTPPPIAGAGTPLPSATRAALEPEFGRDLGGVRIHADEGARHAAELLQAEAFTTGSNIYFNQGRYDPSSPQGQGLLAHEVTHALQQESGAAGGTVQTQPVAGAGSAAPSGAKRAVHTFPFGGESKAFLRDYLDERVTAVAVNLFIGTGLVYLHVEQGKEPLTVPLSEFLPGPVNLFPVFPEAATADAARARVKPDLAKALAERGFTLCFFYRGQGGLIWPTLLNEQTLPRTTDTVRRAEAKERAAARETAEALAQVALWYVGARLPMRTAPSKPAAPTKAAAPAAATQTLAALTPLQRSVALEAQTILRSKELAQLSAAHKAGKAAEVVVQGRTIVYEPSLKASGMTLFGENGFIIGREAFKSGAELTKTLLHELHRLATTASKAEGVSGGLAAAETSAAASFADDLYALGLKMGLW